MSEFVLHHVDRRDKTLVGCCKARGHKASIPMKVMDASDAGYIAWQCGECERIDSQPKPPAEYKPPTKAQLKLYMKLAHKAALGHSRKSVMSKNVTELGAVVINFETREIRTLTTSPARVVDVKDVGPIIDAMGTLQEAGLYEEPQ